MKDLEQKHLEAIERNQELYSHIAKFLLNDEIAESCALITQKYGEIQRLEAEIKCYKQLVPYVGIFREEGQEHILDLEGQLKELKDDKGRVL